MKEVLGLVISDAGSNKHFQSVSIHSTQYHSPIHISERTNKHVQSVHLSQMDYKLANSNHHLWNRKL